MASRIAKAGYSVAYANLEDDETYIGRRIDSILTGISTHNTKHHLDKVKKRVFDIDGNVYIKDFPMNITTTVQLKA